MRIFYALLIVLYGGWLWWYGGTGEPVTESEVATYLERVADNARASGREPSPELLYELADAGQHR